MKTVFITTVYNEENDLRLFLNSLFLQTVLPEQIIIVDGYSTDSTFRILNSEKDKFLKLHKKTEIKILRKKGNRSIGRNTAIKNSDAEIILCSDSGCILDKNWIKKMIESFRSQKVDVVAGYYKGKAVTAFQKALIPYVLVMPDKVDSNNFLPATRSIGFTKKIWKKAGGFPEKFSHNEDYVFAKKLKEIGAKIIFQRHAIVNWIPRNNLISSFIMFFRFAYGDGEAKILRWKVVLIFLRYIFLILLVVLFFIYNISFKYIAYLSVLYIIYAIFKNYRYVKNLSALVYLPSLQFCSDIAILMGTTLGLLKKSKNIRH